jgi:hypothetical protein
MRISKTMSRSHSRPHTSFNDLVQDLKPVSKILFNTLFRTSKTRLRSFRQDLKPISKISLRTSEQGQDLLFKISNQFLGSHLRPQITFKDLVRTSKTRLRSLSQDLKPISKISLRTSEQGQDLKSVFRISFKTSNRIQRSCSDLKNKVTFSQSRPQTRDLV